MVKLPRRPDLARLAEIEPELRTLEPGLRLHRIYARGGDCPTRWNEFSDVGPLRGRFDHHLPLAEGHLMPKLTNLTIMT